MINKIYVKTINFIKESYLWLLFYAVFIAVMLFPLPYYIYIGGGIINTSDKISVDNETTSQGSFNMCYVEEIYATLPTYLLSYIIPGWDLVAKEEVTLTGKETQEDVAIRNKIYLEEANQNAIITAFNNTNHKLKIKDNHLYVIYVENDLNTDLKVGDEILEIDGKIVNDVEDITDIIATKQDKDIIKIKVISNNEEIVKYGEIKQKENIKKLGIAIAPIYDYETDPKVKFSFSNTESGPSGGLMITLSLYDKLIDADLTKGLKIAGTGTIDKEGNVGEIGGIKYKLKGAVDSDADIFLVPNGKNYNEAIKLQEENGYDIKVIGIDTFEDAINKLK